jgi:hypothetical protein
LPAFPTVYLDNNQSNVAISYAMGIEPAPNSEPWAAFSSAPTTVPAFNALPLTLTPAADLCSQVTSTTGPMAFTVTVHYGIVGSSLPLMTTITDTVYPYVIK